MKALLKTALVLLALFLGHHKSMAAELNFAQTIYFTAPDSTSLPGTVLTSSGTSLLGFNFSNAPANHPLFKSGVYFPVTDCQNKNLWVKMRHIAADPNGRTNGQNIGQTLNDPFYGGNNMVGGWNGFLYEFEIYIDQNATGQRNNVLGVLFPTSITVASLETLCCPEGPFEWLSFEILNPEASGWNLNSINFTGNNVNSKPGFTKTPVFVRANQNSYRPPEFTTNFPTGSDSIYAITLTTIGGQYSEFKMSGSQISRFRYGYEYNPGGYQGMSMAFGEGPKLEDSLVNEKCHKTGGSIYIKPSGLGPYTYSWSNGLSTQHLINAAPGQYSVTVKDGNNCTNQVSKTILAAPVFTQSLSQQVLAGDSIALLVPSVTGGEAPLSYLWNTGNTNDSLWVDSNGVYILTIKDSKNCLAKDTLVVSQLTSLNEPFESRKISLFPNPVKDVLTVQFENLADMPEIKVFNVQGKQMQVKSIPKPGSVVLDLKPLPGGCYVLIAQVQSTTQTAFFIKE